MPKPKNENNNHKRAKDGTDKVFLLLVRLNRQSRRCCRSRSPPPFAQPRTVEVPTTGRSAAIAAIVIVMMIISKDLFIFGEQIFATIIPDGSNSAVVPTVATTTTPTTASSAEQQPEEQRQHQQQQLQQQYQLQQALYAVDTLKRIATVAARSPSSSAAAPAKTPPPTTTTSPKSISSTPTVPPPTGTTAFSQQETVAVPVAAARIECSSNSQPNGNSDNRGGGGATTKGSTADVNAIDGDKRRAKDNLHATSDGITSVFVEEEELEDRAEQQEEEDREPLMSMARKKLITPAAVIAPVNGLNGLNGGKPAKLLHNNHLKRLQEHDINSECSLHLLKENRDTTSAVALSGDATLASGSASGSSISPANSTSSTISVGDPAQGDLASAPPLTPLHNGEKQQPAKNAAIDRTMLSNGNGCGHGSSYSDAENGHASTFRFIPEEHRTLQLTFQGITVLHNDRKILSDVSGLVSPGEVLAIMGPSGSGKTTLLDCFSGQRRFDGGSIHLNSEPLSKRWRRKIGYVLQEEVFFAGLTLRETVMYTALLRLPETMPKSKKVKLVDAILETLELNFCQQTKFGDYLNRGLSGGEKKRANIACELLTNPLLMLLDEPTSGLDSHSALSLMKVLKRYAVQEQKTIVMSVHQPSSQMFHMFDKLLLLYNGRTAYFGEVHNIYRYFEDIGVSIKPHYNPADFILEQVKSYPDIREKLFMAAKESHCNFLNRNCITIDHHSGQQNQTFQHHHAHQHQHGEVLGTLSTPVTRNSVCAGVEKAYNAKFINDFMNNYYKDMDKNDGGVILTDVHVNSYKEEEAADQLWCGKDSQSNFSSSSSDHHQKSPNNNHNHQNGRSQHRHHHHNDLHHHHHDHQDPPDQEADWLDYPTGFCTQFRVLSCRNCKEAIPRMLSKLNWFQTVGLALMAGAIWFQIPRTEEYLHDLQGWMFFSQTYWMLFALFGALNSFPSEREVISKERRSGAYRLSAYYLAKMFGELPLVVTLPTVYLMISYPMLGCTSLKLFFLMLVFLLLNTIVAQSVGFFIGACCMDMNVSITLSALYTLATQLFGGYLSSRIPDGLSWVRYTSMIHYAYQNMQILEFREGPPISCGSPSSFEICKHIPTEVAVVETAKMAGPTFIPYQEILRAQNSTSPLWLNTLILFMFFLVFRGLGYAVLRYVRCPKA